MRNSDPNHAQEHPTRLFWDIVCGLWMMAFVLYAGGIAFSMLNDVLASLMPVLSIVLASDERWWLSAKENWFMVGGAILGAAFTVYWAGREIRSRYRQNLLAAKEALIERLQFNDIRVVQMLEQLASGGTPNYPLDTVGIIIWLSRSKDILSGPVVDQINWHRYQLDHVDLKLRDYRTLLIVAIGQNLDQARMEVVRGERASIVRHLGEVHENIHKLIELVRSDKGVKNK